MNWKQKIAFRVKVIAADLSQSDFLSLILSETQAIEIGLVVNNAGFVRWYSDHWLPQSLLAIAFVANSANQTHVHARAWMIARVTAANCVLKSMGPSGWRSDCVGCNKPTITLDRALLDQRLSSRLCCGHWLIDWL
jgi:hypothetical protein